MKNSISKEDEERIVNAIKEAELNTSGEICVHIQKKLRGDIEKASQMKFIQLHIHKTEKRNGVLFYIAYNDRKLAVLGDIGINSAVPENFWQSTIDIMRENFKNGDLVGGIEEGVKHAGEALKKYFPHESDDKNELPNEVSIA